MKKFLSFEHTFTRSDIERMMRREIEQSLSSQDKDFREAYWCDIDFTYQKREDGAFDVEVSINCADIKFRKP